MRALVLALLLFLGCSSMVPRAQPFAELRDVESLARLALQDQPLSGHAHRRLVRLNDWGAYEQTIDLRPALPVFTTALRSPNPSVQRRALRLLGELAAGWSYGFEVDFLDQLKPDAYDRPFVEPLLPDLIRILESGPAHLRYEVVLQGLTIAHLLVLMDRRDSRFEDALRAAQSDRDHMVAAFAVQTVHTLDALIRQPRCKRQ